MERYNGTIAYGGVAIGPVCIFSDSGNVVVKRLVEDTTLEISRLDDAMLIAEEELGKLFDTVSSTAGVESASIFEAHKSILHDVEYIDFIKSKILNEQVNSEYATWSVACRLFDVFSQMEDEYTKARAIDIKDVSKRIIRILDAEEGMLGGSEIINGKTSKKVVLLAEDITPSDFIRLDKTNLCGVILNKGTINSHTSILARNLGIPTIVGTKIDKNSVVWKPDFDKEIIIDGFNGEIIVDPDSDAILLAQKLKENDKRNTDIALTYKGKESITKSGRRIPVCANIEGLGNIDSVIENDAEGIGLFRSEFLYLGRDTYPTEDEQFEAYKSVLKAMKNKKVVIRTLDIGLDKRAEYFNIKDEVNPALGYRAVRISLSEPNIFKTQLRALLRAGVYGDLSILYPMITSVWEIREIKSIFDEVVKELSNLGISYSIPKQGVMIETPAAVMISDSLAEESDFLSIGTNDLTQYTLALDRQNPRLVRFFDPHHEAILRMIKMTIDNAHRVGKEVGICGELASDMDLTNIFIDMGVDMLSVTPTMILPIRRIICES